MILTFSPTKHLGILSRIRFSLEAADWSCGRCAKSFPNVSTEFKTVFLEHSAQWIRAPGTAARSVEYYNIMGIFCASSVCPTAMIVAGICGPSFAGNFVVFFLLE